MPETQVFVWEVDIDVQAATLWPFVSDTQRIQRLAGLWPHHYEYRPLASGGSEVHVKAKARGLSLEWVEHPTEWMAPEFYRITRIYSRGPWTKLVSEVRLEPGPDPQSTHLVHRATATPRGLWGAIVSRLGSRSTGDGFRRAYRLAGQWAKDGILPGSQSAHDTATSRVIKERLSKILYPIAERLDAVPSYRRLYDHLLQQPASELTSLAPYALADSWTLPRHAMRTLMMHGAKDGIFDVQYNLICPSCRRSKAVFDALKDVGPTGHCDTCNIDFGVDFDRAIEVRFCPRPLGIESLAVTYCHAGPGFTPHRLAHFALAADAKQDAVIGLEEGRYTFHSPQCKGSVYCEVVAEGEEEAGATARLTLGLGGVAGVPAKLRAGDVKLGIANALEIPATLAIARADWADDALSAAEVSTMQTFRDLFGSELLAPGAEFGIQHLVFLFSDLVGSTAMYERIGDASAFAMVRDHFELLKAVYTRHSGSLVKTIGDAVMAVFRSPNDALRAALEMHQEVGRIKDRAGNPLVLRIGLHRGPCIVMAANGVADYFGTTVNLAARVQGQAGPAEVALGPAMMDDGEVQARLAEGDYRTHTREVELKGLGGRHALTIVTAPAGPVVEQSES